MASTRLAAQTMREQFIEKRFQPASMRLIDTANDILIEYQNQGLAVTLRQLYYQFVARGLLPNKQKEYKRLGSIISDARMAGLINWSMMEDRTRFLRQESKWDTPADIVAAIADQYKEDLWRTQPYRPEVWIEKDALIGVIEGTCNELRVPFFACRGYSSQSAQYETGRRFRQYVQEGQKPIILHFGDHDPSGMDMTRDNDARVNLFTRDGVIVKRLALNRDQIDRYNPPPNPAKESDSRAAEYIREYGDESWELDALEPRVIGRLIRDEINELRDDTAWEEAEQEERDGRADIQLVSDSWDDVVRWVKG